MSPHITSTLTILFFVALTGIGLTWLVSELLKATTMQCRRMHLEPRYYGYQGGYSTIVICRDCGLTALYEDCHLTDPCPLCGGVKDLAEGKWTKGEDGIYYWRTKREVMALED